MRRIFRLIEEEDGKLSANYVEYDSKGNATLNWSIPAATEKFEGFLNEISERHPSRSTTTAPKTDIGASSDPGRATNLSSDASQEVGEVAAGKEPSDPVGVGSGTMPSQDAQPEDDQAKAAGESTEVTT